MASVGGKKLRTNFVDAKLLSVHLFKGPMARVVSSRSVGDEELMIMLGGQYRARLVNAEGSNALVEARAGDVVYWPIGVARLEESVPGKPMRCIAAYLRWNNTPFRSPVLVRDRERVITILAQRLLTLRHLPVNVPPAVPNGYLAAMLAEVMRDTLSEADMFVGRVARYVDMRLEEPFSLKELAHDIGLDRHHFGRRFKKATGLTPMEYVRRRRADHALNSFLADSRRTPKEVARKVGVRDAYQLRRLLKRYYGISYRDIKTGARSVKGWRKLDEHAGRDWWLSPITAGLV